MPDATVERLGRNSPCHCGSGKKYKRCCLTKDEANEREARVKVAAEPTTPPPEKPFAPDAAKPKRPTDQPWKRGADNTRSFQRFSMPRKRGGG